MWKLRLLAALLSVPFAGIATGLAAVPRDTGERLESRRDHEQQDRAREARLTLPRTASGGIDVPKLITEIRAAITRGATEIRFRDAVLTAEDVKTLRELAARFGFERVRVREDGRRVRVDFREEDRDDAHNRAEVRKDDDRGRRDGRDAQAGRRVDARPERIVRAERAEKAERAERPEKA